VLYWLRGDIGYDQEEVSCWKLFVSNCIAEII